VLRRTSAVQPLRVPSGATRWLRITITGTTRATAEAVSAGLGAGISDVLIPGVRVQRLLRPAQDPAGQRAPVQTVSFAQQLPSPALLGGAAAYPPLARTFTTTTATSMRLTATAMALPGPALTALLSRLTPPAAGQLRVTATSTLGSLPALAPAQLLSNPPPRAAAATPDSGNAGSASPASGNAASGNAASGNAASGNAESSAAASGPWIAGSAHPVLRLSWTGDRRIADLTLAPDAGVGAFPQRVRISSPAGVREASVGFGGLVTLSPPLVTDQLSISFPASEPASAAAAAQRGRLPVALGHLTIPALAGLHPALPDPAAPFTLPCGQGPTLTIDARTYPTAVTGQVSALTNFRPVQLRLCSPGSAAAPAPPGTPATPATPAAPGTPATRPASGTPSAPALSLSVGQHVLTAAAPDPFALTSLALTSGASTAARPAVSRASMSRPAAPQAATNDMNVQSLLQEQQQPHGHVVSGEAAPAVGRSMRVMTWQADRRSLRVAAGPASYLEIHQNANPGWIATLNGRRLASVTLDGWQQGYVLPAGRGGVVTLTYAPDGVYHLLLVAAALGVLLLLAAALPPRRRRRPALPSPGRVPVPPSPGRVPADPSTSASPPVPGTSPAPESLSVPGSTPAPGPPAPRPGAGTWAGVAVLAALIFVAGGPVAVVVPLLAGLAWSRPRWLPAVAAAGIAAAGVIAATAASPAALGSGAFGATAQACALAALAAALMPAGKLRDRRRSGTKQS
jgi:arabinofuranan 3-O-arabinosyltransferase